MLNASCRPNVATGTQIPNLVGDAMDGTWELHCRDRSVNPSPAGALEMAARAAKVFGEGDVAVDVLHVGTTMPKLNLPGGPTWNETARTGDPVEEIVRAAERQHPGLIVMATAGHEGFVDALRGSTTEQVLRRSPCPLLAVPSP